jgi:hypothetical protein
MISVVRRRSNAVNKDKDIKDGGRGRTTVTMAARRLGNLATEGSGGQRHQWGGAKVILMTALEDEETVQVV